MGDQKKVNIQALSSLLKENESWLMSRILQYAKQYGYTKYTSTLQESWRVSIAGLTDAIIKAIETYEDQIPQFSPEDDFKQDPITQFGTIEAGKHRERGINLGMFLGLLKYYRQAYVDLIDEQAQSFKSHFNLFIIRCFDRFELALCTEWADLNTDNQVKELQNKNRLITNEKNKYLTLFESLSEPALLVDNDDQIENLNHAAAKLLGFKGGTGKFYYQEQKILKNIDSIRIPIKHALPWLAEELEKFTTDKEETCQIEKKLIINKMEKHIEVTTSKMMDISGKFTGVVIVLKDITEKRLSDKIRIEKERLNGVIEMAGTVCHEFNQPLQNISGYADLMLFEMDDPNTQHKKLIKIKRQIDRISILTKKLMNITRYETRDYIKGKKIIDLDKSASNSDK